MIHTPRSAPSSIEIGNPRAPGVAALVAHFASMGTSPHAIELADLRGTKVGNADWVDRACMAAQAIANQGAPCTDPQRCQPITLGIPQGAAAGVIAPAAAATFTLTVPIDFIPYQFVLSGGAVALQVTDVHAALSGPMIFGTATSPLGGDLFGANVQNEVPLKTQKVTAGQQMFFTLQNPTLANVTFVGSIKGLAA